MASFDQLRRIDTRPADAGRSRVLGAAIAAVVTAALASLRLLAQLAGQREQEGMSGFGLSPADARRSTPAFAGALEPNGVAR